jgi:predicted Zn-dependent protease
MRERMDRAKALAAVGILLGAGAMASGGDIGDAAGQAILQGGGSMLQRSLLGYKRDEESSADRAALTLLEKTKQSGRGMLQSFERMGSRMLFSTSRVDPYIQSHPLPAQRIALLKAKAEESRYFDSKDPPELQLRHDMARSKIAAYTGGVGAVQRLFDRDQSNPAAQYGVAISEFLRGRAGSAIPMIDKLIAKYPRNPYLHEMKAEMLLKAQRANEAVRPMQTALKLAPYDTGLLNIQLGQILMETRNPANLQVAIRELKKGLAKDPNTISGYAYLARAYSMNGEEGLALSATAEQRFLQGRFDDAKSFAARAQQKLPKNSPEWVRMQDITLYKKKK